MFACMQRYVDPRHTAHFMPPHTSAIHDHIAGDMATTAIFRPPVNTGHPPALTGNRADFNAFLDQGATLAGPFCQSQGNICRIALAIFV